MKGSISKDSFEAGLVIAARAASSRTTLPVLYNVLMEIKDGMLYFSCTDLELGISLGIECEGENGKACVNASQLSSLVSSMPKGKMEFSTNEKFDFAINCGGFKTKVKGLDPNEFPLVRDEEYGKNLRMKAKDFSNVYHKVGFCTSSEKTRPNLAGIHVLTEGKEIKFTSSDGYRFSILSLETEEENEGFAKGVIVPKRFISEVGKIFSGDFDLTVNDYGKVIAHDGFTYVSATVVNSQFPDMKNMIPTEEICKLVVSKEQLLSSVKHTGIIAKDDINRLSFDLLENKLQLSANSQESGESVVSIDAEITGELKEGVILSYVYIGEFLNSIPEKDKIEFSFSKIHGWGAMVFRYNTDGYRHVIVPFSQNK